MDFLIKLICTVFFLGYLPLMPGTFGSLAGLAIFLFVTDMRWGLVALAVSLALGFLLSGKAERLFGRKDSSHIVIDEVAGMLITLLFVPHTIPLALIGFLMFRIFDTLKPFPAGRLQHLKGSTGVMIDDIIAGLYANLVLQVIIRLI
jgi:phosphatidylglycerophosphatase A